MFEAASLPHVIAAVRSRMRQVALRRLAPFGLSLQQYQVLMTVSENAGICHGDLARRTWMDKPTASRVLRALQDRGLLRTEADPGRGNRLRIHLEHRAEPLVKRLTGFRMEIREDMERDLSRAERIQVRRILAKVMGNLDLMDEVLPGPKPVTKGA